MDDPDEVRQQLLLFPQQEDAVRLCVQLSVGGGGEERTLDRLEALLKPYHELPQALDRALARMLPPLLLRVHTSACCARAIYLLCKIRGRKHVAQLLPRQVEHMDEALGLLMKTDLAAWESRFVGLVWLSILVLLPFELESITDTSLVDVRQMLVGGYLQDTRPTMGPASLCLAKLLTRPDASEEMVRFLRCDHTTNGGVVVVGLLLAKAAVFKRSSQDVGPLAVELFPGILAQAEAHFAHVDATTRCVYLKLLRRMFSRDVLLAGSSGGGERFVGFCLARALGDADSRVRWQAAKAMRKLVEEHGGMEVYDAVLSHVFDNAAATAAGEAATDEEDLWHGACLAVGEMIRAAKKLTGGGGVVVPVRRTIDLCVRNALGFDKRRGTRNLGSNIRDAGCYVAWALVRSVSRHAFTDKDCRELAELLVITSLFDREVSCRRAASAALQECVGRLGRVPQGIDLLVMVSYQAVGSVHRAYGAVCDAVCAASPGGYCARVVDHLLHVKLRHWDETIRQLAAAALGRNVGSSSISSRDDAVLVLTDRVTAAHANQFELHGGLLGLAEIILSQGAEGGAVVDLTNTLKHTALAIRTRFPVSLAMLRNAWFRLLLAAATRGSAHASDEEEEEDFAVLLREGLSGEATRQAAMPALVAILRRHEPASASEYARWMFNVYGLHACMLAACGRDEEEEDSARALLSGLEQCLRNRSGPHQDRVEALVALQSVPQALVDDAFAVCSLLGVEDYSHSNQHGDVGSWVRRQACLSLCALHLRGGGGRVAASTAATQCAFLACDKLDHVREAGVRALFELTGQADLYADAWTLEESFQHVLHVFLLSSSASADAAEVRRGLIRGLLVTAGSLTESPSQAAQDALEQWWLASSSPSSSASLVYDCALDLLREHQAEDQDAVFTAVCKSLGFVLWNLSHHHHADSPSLCPEWCAAIVHVMTAPPPPAPVLQQQRRRRPGRSIARQTAVAHVLLGLTTTSASLCWPEIANLLASDFPALRRQVAEAVYLWASGLPSSSSASLQPAMDVCLPVWLQTGGGGNDLAALRAALLAAVSI